MFELLKMVSYASTIVLIGVEAWRIYKQTRVSDEEESQDSRDIGDSSDGGDSDR